MSGQHNSSSNTSRSTSSSTSSTNSSMAQISKVSTRSHNNTILDWPWGWGQPPQWWVAAKHGQEPTRESPPNSRTPCQHSLHPDHPETWTPHNREKFLLAPHKYSSKHSTMKSLTGGISVALKKHLKQVKPINQQTTTLKGNKFLLQRTHCWVSC